MPPWSWPWFSRGRQGVPGKSPLTREFKGSTTRSALYKTPGRTRIFSSSLERSYEFHSQNCISARQKPEADTTTSNQQCCAEPVKRGAEVLAKGLPQDCRDRERRRVKEEEEQIPQ